MVHRFTRLAGAGVLAGFVAGLVNLGAIDLTKAVALKPGTGGLAYLVFGRDLGIFGTELFHVASGVAMALLYVFLVRERLPGPAWLRGILFAQVPGAIQLLVVLPLNGDGVGGWRLSAATPFLAWSLNALFGSLMGAIVAGIG